MDYAARVQSLRSAYDKATARKEDKENELDKLKLEYKNLVLECKNVYNCKPNELSGLIEKKQKTVDKKLVEAEISLKTVKENLNANDKS